MTEFKLDTSGEIMRPSPNGFIYPTAWPDLDPFTQGYIEALFAAEFATLDTEHVSQVMAYRGDGTCPGFSDLAPETLARIKEDCGPDARGYRAVTSVNMQYEITRGGGAQFYTDRQAGMWADFPPLIVHLGDDGKVRFQ